MASVEAVKGDLPCPIKVILYTDAFFSFPQARHAINKGRRKIFAFKMALQLTVLKISAVLAKSLYIYVERHSKLHTNTIFSPWISSTIKLYCNPDVFSTTHPSCSCMPDELTQLTDI